MTVKVLRGVYRRKLEMVILMRKTLPLYAQRVSRFSLLKRGERLVMHGNTDDALH
jgi:hypothetical protein